MHEGEAVRIIRSALELGLWLIGPTLVAISVAGLVVSILQALTQVQEQTVAFMVKAAVTLLCLWCMGPWMLHRLCEHLRLTLECFAR